MNMKMEIRKRKMGMIQKETGILPDFPNLAPAKCTGYPEATHRVPAVCIFAENVLYRASKKVS